jgi:4-hydroxybenzoate polyprenyltransferase
VKESNSLIVNLLKLFRWNNLLIILATQYLAAYALIPEQTLASLAENWRLLIMSISTISIAAAGYVINDYYDVKIDYVNRPNRVVVGRFLKRRSILFIHAGLNGVGILGGLLVSWQVGLINFLAAGLLWLYSNQLKRLALLGNTSVGFLTGMAVFVVYVLFKESIFLFSAYAFFAFFISLIREIIKDMEDVEGDKKFDCKTLPIVIGQRYTKLVIYIIVLIFIGVVAILLQEEPKFWYVLGGLTLMLSILTYRLAWADKTIDFAKLSGFCKQIMILGLISMIFLK